ncbi:hypothetical protein NBRC10512_001242 [Rhodotorula toruloides]|uniref:RHTO0S10e07228g1_1 n=2 Tax=Rhodotorula toruloides TaxID=5286 RepID=A0A061B794_RHOTO|nr:arrestin domain protein [Rhodotorula toruloides NP11]EMS22682.1 arrestin domain protein [Rhodotorula toruloides NP11]CDR45259.1 RHTO0S10e07228g1_1 [Rhodotorula toruloides]
MSSASLRLTEPVVFLVGGLDYERARQRQRRATARAANAAAGNGTETAATSPAESRNHSPARLFSNSRAASLSRPGSRAASPAPPLSRAAIPQGDDFVPPNSRGRSSSRTRRVDPPPPTGPAEPRPGEGISRGRSGSLVREMTEAQIRLREQQEHEALDEPPPAMLRGLLTVHLSKPTRVKEISVRFKGVARTDWPEGIGPRRLDVMEENLLINVTNTFFSAASSSMNRRAASIGPGSGDHGEEPRGRSSRRAASVAPGRELSHGRSYPPNSLFRQQPSPVTSTISVGEVSRAPNLSRIASEESVNGLVPPIQPGEAAPAYEVAVESQPGSPMHLPHAPNLSVDTLDLGSPAQLAFRNSSRQFDRSPTPSRSPLATANPIISPSTSNHDLRLNRTSTGASRLSHESGSSLSTHSDETDRPHLDRHASSGASTAASQSSDSEINGTGWNSAPVPGTAASSIHRGRPATRSRNLMAGIEQLGEDEAGSLDVVTNGVSGMTFQPKSSTRQPPAPSASSERGRRASTSSNATARRVSSSDRPTALPSALKSTGSSSSSARSASRGARFSLSGVTDVFRHKSSSRARDMQRDESVASTTRRDASPDTQRGGSRMRSQSRGRKTALKALRDALVAGHHHHHNAERDGSDDEGHRDSDVLAVGDGWKEFRAGTYTYPISIPVPASLPPTLDCEFGHVHYTLKATVHRAGALTTNLTSSTDVTLVTTLGEEDTEESESIVVERFWETQVKYHVALSGKSFPIGGQIPVSIRLNPLAKIKLYRITAQLEQKTSYFASVSSGRKLTRHETPKRFQLLRIENKDPKEPLLPILSDDPNVLANHPLKDFFINTSSSSDETPSLLDPIGPWHLDGTLQLPDCSTKLNVSTNHEKSNISITHTLKIMLRVERGDDEYLDSKGNRKLWDIVVEAGAVMLSCHLSQNVLPAYTDATSSLSGSTRPRRNTITARTPTHTCGADHGNRHHGLHINVGGSSSTGRSHSSGPPVASLEQNLLFARLISGETTPAGETPPTYEAVVDGTAPEGHAPNEARAQVVATEEEERGRSSSRRD